MVFQRVIAGIDGTRASFEAGRQAARLVRPGGSLDLVAITDPYLLTLNRWGARPLIEPGEVDEGGLGALAERRLTDYAKESLALMRSQLPDALSVREQVFAGKSWEVLRAMAVDESADLIAVGSHGDRRLAGIVRGSTATELLHDAPCSTLVARAAIDPGRFPSSVVVGVDGSTESFAGLDLAKELVTASGGAAGGRALIASGANVDIGDLEGPAAPLAVARRSVGPIKVLIEASGACDLVILGARGLTGHRALGSVSERVAHRADCSVLVVRPSD